MSRAAKQSHQEAGVLSVQAIRAGEIIGQTGRPYRILWLETAHETGNRKLLVQPPGTLADEQNTAGSKGYVVSFAEEFLFLFGLEDSYPFRIKSTLPKTQMTTVDVLNCPTGKTIERTIENLKDRCYRLPQGHLLLSGFLKILLVSVSRMFQYHDQGQVNCADHQLFERFLNLISQRDLHKMGMQDYARALSIRTDLLSETIKKVSGYPASHHIYQHIIRTAKHAALGSSSTMKEVAFGLGFKDVAHFSKFFRNKAGMTFSDYKKAYQRI